VVNDFSYSKRYKPTYFEQEFFGSRLIEHTLEIEPYMSEVGKKQYSTFKNPLDFILTGCFDHWIGNADRKPENPNLLLSIDDSGKYSWHPIDHTAAFAYNEYKNVRDAMVRVNKSILECGFVRSICKYEDKKKLENLSKNVDICISNSLKEIDKIFEQVPKSWGFGKKSKAKLKAFFSHKERNQRMATIYQQYLK